jgi:hypothetical protein
VLFSLLPGEKLGMRTEYDARETRSKRKEKVPRNNRSRDFPKIIPKE